MEVASAGREREICKAAGMGKNSRMDWTREVRHVEKESLPAIRTDLRQSEPFNRQWIRLARKVFV
jgi:hypothetical protein